ncbi:MAG TPA: ROK family protein [Ornithinimicrobium sp.]|uniref:ROK family protein n=1 Tax=Ornithinimicrobium sp. TaxID=1977084 RepID=UPI002B47A2C3|nr:ROK family protein [Ornithinimicrobium sp.]HKJ12100.1 ROK family protein [Ornithinimicrobium sp.]
MPDSEDLTLRPSDDAVGVDIGGTKIAAGRVDGQGVVHEQVQRPTPPRTAPPRDVEDAIVAAVGELRVDSRAPVGVGAAGFVNAAGRVVRFAPHVSWREEPLADRLEARLGRPVHLENDANAAAWAEYRFGAAQDEPRVLMVTVGTGIGGGLVYQGRLERGAQGMAGEFGHMVAVPSGRPCECGNHGCWEQYASGAAVRWEARARLQRRSGPVSAWVRAGMGDPAAVTGERVSLLAQTGDPLAGEVFAAVGTWLGRGVADLVAALDPGVVVVGGGVAQAGELLLEPARAALGSTLSGRGYRECPALVAGAVGPGAGLVGAADLARWAG